MAKTILIADIYRTLRERRITDSQYDFSLSWLGAARSYYSAIKCMRREPGTDTLIILAARLDAFANQLAASSSYRLGSAIRETHAEILGILELLRTAPLKNL